MWSRIPRRRPGLKDSTPWFPPSTSKHPVIGTCVEEERSGEPVAVGWASERPLRRLRLRPKRGVTSRDCKNRSN